MLFFLRSELSSASRLWSARELSSLRFFLFGGGRFCEPRVTWLLFVFGLGAAPLRMAGALHDEVFPSGGAADEGSASFVAANLCCPDASLGSEGKKAATSEHCASCVSLRSSGGKSFVGGEESQQGASAAEPSLWGLEHSSRDTAASSSREEASQGATPGVGETLFSERRTSLLFGEDLNGGSSCSRSASLTGSASRRFFERELSLSANSDDESSSCRAGDEGLGKDSDEALSNQLLRLARRIRSLALEAPSLALRQGSPHSPREGFLNSSEASLSADASSPTAFQQSSLRESDALLDVAAALETAADTSTRLVERVRTNKHKAFSSGSLKEAAS